MEDGIPSLQVPDLASDQQEEANPRPVHHPWSSSGAGLGTWYWLVGPPKYLSEF